MPTEKTAARARAATQKPVIEAALQCIGQTATESGFDALAARVGLKGRSLYTAWLGHQPIGKAALRAVQDVAAGSRAGSPVVSPRHDAPSGMEVIPLRRVPLLSWAHAGEAVDYDELPTGWQKAVPTDIDDPKAFAVAVAGDSMEPRYQEGDVAILNPSRPLRQNDAVIARVEDQGVVFKLCSRAGDTFRFSSYNPAYAPFEVPVGKVVWIYPVHSVLKLVMK